MVENFKMKGISISKTTVQVKKKAVPKYWYTGDHILAFPENTAAPRYILQYIPRRRGIYCSIYRGIPRRRGIYRYITRAAPYPFFFFTCTVVFDILIPFILKFSTISSQAQK